MNPMLNVWTLERIIAKFIPSYKDVGDTFHEHCIDFYSYILPLDLEKMLLSSDRKFYTIFGDYGNWDRFLPTPDEVQFMIDNDIPLLYWHPEEAVYTKINGTIWLDTLHEFCHKNGLPPNMIYFVTGNFGIDQMYDSWKWAHNYKGESINFITFEIFKYNVFHYKDVTEAELKEETNARFIEGRKLDFAYLCLNKRGCSIRKSMIELLHSRNILVSGLVSYIDIGNIDRLNPKISKKGSLIIDTTELHICDNHNTKNIWYNLHDSTYFSAVNETFFTKELSDDFGEDYRFVTEKTFKCIRYLHPFIVFSRPGHLARLHELGYKTFDRFIDESYDLEEDDTKRMQMAMNEVEKLCALDFKQLSEMIFDLRDVLIHNQRHLIYNYDDIRILIEKLLGD